MNTVAQYVGYFFMTCMLLGLILIACAERKKKDVPASPGLRPEEAERAFPGPVIEHGALADREHGRMGHDKDFEEKRWLWAASMEAELLVMDVEEGF